MKYYLFLPYYIHIYIEREREREIVHKFSIYGICYKMIKCHNNHTKKINKQQQHVSQHILFGSKHITTSIHFYIFYLGANISQQSIQFFTIRKGIKFIPHYIFMYFIWE